MALGDRIRELRDEKDLSLREFAKKLGCSAPFLSDIELGRRYPSEKLLVEIARNLGVTVDALKAHDVRPPVEKMKERIAADPRYALAFRKVIDQDFTPEELIKIAETKAKRKPR
jgi:transcriptional regulator with XRE-family HTH domain